MALAALVAASSAHAQEGGRWALCGALLVPPVEGDPAARSAPDTPVRGRAERAVVEADEGVYVLTGDAELTRADQRIRAERLRYRAATGELRARGGVELLDRGTLVRGERLDYDLDSDSGRFEGVAEYRIAAGHLQGRAEAVIADGPMRSRYQGVSLTTCNPGEEVWWLHAGEVSIDREARQGSAWNAWLSIWNVPVFYTPYITFPVGTDRKSGFLAPTLGRSDEGGASFSLPYYWNIAPNYDATLTPEIFAERGLLLGGEVRYLERWGRGEVGGAYLPGDNVFGDDRWSIEQRHRWRAGDRVRIELEQQRVSDPFYVDDFSTDFDRRSASFLESFGTVSWAAGDFRASLDAQAWQSLDPDIAAASEPYAREPRLQAAYDPLRSPLPLAFSISGELTEFTHPAPEARDTGSRLDLSPRVALPLRTLGYYVEPAVTWRYTAYDLDRPDASLPERPERSLPVYTVDAGLFLERPSQLFTGVRQTLEPRAFYRAAPTRDQDQLPRFDTGRSATTFGQLFRESAFTGPDRVEDGERLSLGLTTRFVDERSGREYLRASGGQILYFEDREVTLSGEPDRRERSEYVTELRLSLPRGFSAQADYRWDPEASGNSDLRTLLQWRGSATQVINLGLRRREVDGVRTLDQGELSFALPIGPRWRVFGGVIQDFELDQPQQRFAGLQYDACCHALRLTHREYLDRDPGRDGATLESQILLELELKGLGGIGDSIVSFLENEIRGYRPGPFGY
ncbi:LPS-assembly protein LptD [Spiribacter halobius]|uniref:LPS-assembly protein LptD n=1 Tax=Sediminicurvatus halobius TaxID=2182432 RepID=UPI001305037B|nr:LPS-assembly protein LptD [Spiribacter halobius]UEX78796.1 LPS-assembly protein LptD [Spiribacter halobius]